MRRALWLGLALSGAPALAAETTPDSRWSQILTLIQISPNPIHAKSCNERLQICSEVWASQDVLGKHVSAAIRRDPQGKLLYREVCRFEAGNTRRTCVDIDTQRATNEIKLAPGEWREIRE